MSSLPLNTNSSELCFRSSSVGTVVCFTPEVVAHFHAHRQQGKIKTEVGGQLFARFNQKEVRIISVTGPNNTDKQGRYWFNPDRRRQNGEIKKLFQEGIHFVGDWHTHPESVPTPSSLDLASMDECFKKSRHELKGFIMVIVGRAEFPPGLWVSSHAESKWEQLIFVENPI